MSLWPVNHVRLLLDRHEISILGTEGKTFPLGEQVGEALKQAFTHSGARQAEIFLSSSRVDHTIFPGSEHWLNDSDLESLARLRLSAFYARSQETREVRVMRDGFNNPQLATSTERNLLAEVKTAASEAGVRITAIRPITAPVIASLHKETHQLEDCAIWIEETETICLAIRANRQWRSARSIPSKALHHTPSLDLLRRECLAAGLSEIPRIYVATLQTNKSSSLHGVAEYSDISPRLLDQTRASPENTLNFIGHRHHRLGRFLLAVSLAIAATTAAVWQDSRLRKDSAVQTHAAHLATEQQFIRRNQVDRDKNSATRQKLETAYRLQMLPWHPLFSIINDASEDSIGLTTFSADAADASLTLEGEAKSFDDVQNFVDTLNKQSTIRELHIASLTPGNESNGERVRFSLSGTWSTAMPPTVTPDP